MSQFQSSSSPYPGESPNRSHLVGGHARAAELLDLISVAVVDIPGGVVVNSKVRAASGILQCGKTSVDVLDAMSGDSLLLDGQTMAYSDMVKVSVVESIITLTTDDMVVTLRAGNHDTARGIAYLLDQRRGGHGRVTIQATAGEQQEAVHDANDQSAATLRRISCEDNATAVGVTSRSSNLNTTTAAPTTSTAAPQQTAHFITPSSVYAARTEQYARQPGGARVNYTAAVNVLDSLMAPRVSSLGQAPSYPRAAGASGAASSCLDFTSSQLLKANVVKQHPAGLPFSTVPSLRDPASHVRASGATAFDRFFDPEGLKAQRAFPQVQYMQQQGMTSSPSAVMIQQQQAASSSAHVLAASTTHTSGAGDISLNGTIGGGGSRGGTLRTRQLEDALEAQRQELQALRSDLATVVQHQQQQQQQQPSLPSSAGQVQPRRSALVPSSSSSGGIAVSAATGKVSIDFDSILMPTITEDYGTASGPPSTSRHRGLSLAHRIGAGSHGRTPPSFNASSPPSGDSKIQSEDSPAYSLVHGVTPPRMGSDALFGHSNSSSVITPPPAGGSRPAGPPLTSGAGGSSAFSASSAAGMMATVSTPTTAVASSRKPPSPAPDAGPQSAISLSRAAAAVAAASVPSSTSSSVTSTPPPPAGAADAMTTAPSSQLSTPNAVLSNAGTGTSTPSTAALAPAPPQPRPPPPPPMKAPPPPPARAPPPAPQVVAKPSPSAQPYQEPAPQPPVAVAAASSAVPPPGLPPPPPRKAPPPPPPPAGGGSPSGGGGMAAELARRMKKSDA